MGTLRGETRLGRVNSPAEIRNDVYTRAKTIAALPVLRHCTTLYSIISLLTCILISLASCCFGIHTLKMPPRKRRAASPATPVASGGGRRSTRISSSGKKSQYFESDSDDFDEKTGASSADVVKATNGNGTGRKRGRPRKNPASRPASASKKAKVGSEDDGDEFQDEAEEEEDDDDELDEDEEPRVTITPLKKMRPNGDIDYEDERLHPNTLLFLKDLKANNKRSWLKCKLYTQHATPSDLYIDPS